MDCDDNEDLLMEVGCDKHLIIPRLLFHFAPSFLELHGIMEGHKNATCHVINSV